MPNSNEYTVWVSTDFDYALNLRYRDAKITIPYEHLSFVKKEIEHLIAYVEMERSKHATVKP